jgi:hypothetical protein
MQRGRGQPFFTAYYMRNVHEVVVYNVGEVVCGQVVSAFVKHFVVEHG